MYNDIYHYRHCSVCDFMLLIANHVYSVSVLHMTRFVWLGAGPPPDIDGSGCAAPLVQSSNSSRNVRTHTHTHQPPLPSSSIHYPLARLPACPPVCSAPRMHTASPSLFSLCVRTSPLSFPSPSPALCSTQFVSVSVRKNLKIVNTTPGYASS